MKKSQLEKKTRTGFISKVRREIEELVYVGFKHYVGERILGDFHHHKENGTSKDSNGIHSYFKYL